MLFVASYPQLFLIAVQEAFDVRLSLHCGDGSGLAAWVRFGSIVFEKRSCKEFPMPLPCRARAPRGFYSIITDYGFSGSPCIDTGVNVVGMTQRRVDLDPSEPRHWGSHFNNLDHFQRV